MSVNHSAGMGRIKEYDRVGKGIDDHRESKQSDHSNELCRFILTAGIFAYELIKVI